MSARESFFTCSFTSANLRRIAHVRAWDEQEAAQLFRIELAEEDGEDEPGSIEVFRSRRQLLATRYDPPTRSAGSATATL